MQCSHPRVIVLPLYFSLRAGLTSPRLTDVTPLTLSFPNPTLTPFPQHFNLQQEQVSFLPLQGSPVLGLFHFLMGHSRLVRGTTLARRSRPSDRKTEQGEVFHIRVAT